MKNSSKYDPEDIESLMLNKSFNELLPEEKTFVLKHLASETEYDSMRMLLLQSVSTFQSSQTGPPKEMKQRLMTQYRTKHSAPQHNSFWLNLFSSLRTGFVEKPHFALAVASVLLFLGAYFWLNPKDSPKVAQQNETVAPEDLKYDQLSREEEYTPPVSTMVDAEQEIILPDESPTEEITQMAIVEDVPAPTSERSIAGTAIPENVSEFRNADSPEAVSKSVEIAEYAYTADAESMAPTEPTASSLVNDELIALLYTAR